LKHFHDLVVLTTHTKDDPLYYDFRIDKGLITEVGVFFPPGCHNKVYAKVYFQAHQIIPRNQEAWCHGNNGWWTGALYFPVVASPLKCKVEAWSDNCDYNHTITVAVELTPFEQVPMWDKLVSSLDSLLEFIGIRRRYVEVTEELVT